MKWNVSAKIKFDFCCCLLVFLNYANELATVAYPKSHHWIKCWFVFLCCLFPSPSSRLIDSRYYLCLNCTIEQWEKNLNIGKAKSLSPSRKWKILSNHSPNDEQQRQAKIFLYNVRWVILKMIDLAIPTLHYVVWPPVATATVNQTKNGRESRWPEGSVYSSSFFVCDGTTLANQFTSNNSINPEGLLYAADQQTTHTDRSRYLIILLEVWVDELAPTRQLILSYVISLRTGQRCEAHLPIWCDMSQVWAFF